MGEDTLDDPEEGSKSTFKRASSVMDQLPQTEEEVEAMRNAVLAKEGLLISVFDILRNVPRRVLMVFKLNDLTRYGSTL
jgi:aarF domain-containing kinase